MSGRNRGLVPHELPLDLSLGESDICHSTETTKPVRSNRTYMSNILDTAFSAKMNSHLERNLRAPTMDHCPTENQASGSETSTHTTVPAKNEYSKASIYDKAERSYNLVTEGATTNRLL